jgi:parvulin-like peptidyl-prolyl isomerase
MTGAMFKWSALASSLLLSASLVACEGNKTPAPTASPSASAGPVVPAAAPTAAASGTAVAPAASGTADILPAREIAGAQHILVAYKGAELAPKAVTRSKEDAKKRADEALGKITKDKMPFEEAAKKYSDDEGSKAIGGAIGNFEKNAMPEAFSKATFAMKVGDTSEVVETPRGFHIIKRTR